MVAGIMSFLSSNGQTTSNAYKLPADSIANGSSILNNMAGRDSIPSQIGQKSTAGTSQILNQGTTTITSGTSISPNFGVIPNSMNSALELPDISPTLPVFPNTLYMSNTSLKMPTPVIPSISGIQDPYRIPNTAGTPEKPNAN